MEKRIGSTPGFVTKETLVLFGRENRGDGLDFNFDLLFFDNSNKIRLFESSIITRGCNEEGW